MKSLTLITYGGGEILYKMFQAISMLFYGKQAAQIGISELMRPIMLMCATVGGVYAFSKAFFGSTCQTLLLGYFFPLIAICSILMIPPTTVHIEDVLKSSRMEGEALTTSYTVDRVPWLLVKFSETVSSIGYNLSQGVETIMQMPNDTNYNATGMVFGSEASLDISKYRLSNANLEQNLRLFSKQCVLYDIALNLYSLDDIKKSTDLWNFFEHKTSKVRMIRYCPPTASVRFDQCAYVSCKDAIAKMKPLFEKEKEGYAKLEIGKNLPLTFQALTGIQKESKELISQQLTMNVLANELSGGKFAKQRAYNQQQSTYRTMGSLAANGLVTMRIVFEALIYAVFIFVIPLSLLPSGIKYLINWAWLVIWIQMWPPLYAILNYIMQIAANYKFNGWFSSLDVTHKGLSFFTSIGMQNLNDEIFALAAFLSVSVPYLSYILLKEGLSSFVQLAGSLMSPAQQAAGSAASEQASGNYSFANSSFGQTSYHNTTAFQSNMAPSLSSGYFTDNQGEMSTIYGGETPIVRQSTSELRTGVFADDTIGKNLQKQVQEAQSTVENLQENYASGLSTSTRSMSDFITHHAQSSNYSQNVSEREGQSIQESVNYVQNTAENWGKQYGINARDSLDLLVGTALSAGVNAKNFFSAKLNGGGNLTWSVSRDEILNSASNVSKSDAFQQNLQNVMDYAKSQTYTSGNDEGTRHSAALSDSLDRLTSIQSSYQEAQNYLNQASENTSWFEQNSQLVKRSLNQDFIKWANQEHAEIGGFERVKEILSDDCPNETQPLIQNFIRNIREEQGLPQSVQNIKFNREEFSENFNNKKLKIYNEIDGHEISSSKELQKDLSKSFHNDTHRDELNAKFQNNQENYELSSDLQKERWQEYHNYTKENFKAEEGRWLVGRVWDRLDFSSLAFWSNKDES